jgi:hypothetical protein
MMMPMPITSMRQGNEDESQGGFQEVVGLASGVSVRPNHPTLPTFWPARWRFTPFWHDSSGPFGDKTFPMFHHFNRLPPCEPSFVYAPGCVGRPWACQRELPGEALVYTGDWQSKDYALQIFRTATACATPNGTAYPFTWRTGKIESNRIVCIRQRRPNLGRKRFRINQPPATDPNGATFMVLDGQRLSGCKGNGTQID